MVSVRAGYARAGVSLVLVSIYLVLAPNAWGQTMSSSGDSLNASSESYRSHSVVAVGGIACSSQATVSTTSCRQDRVASLALSLRPDSLALLGDIPGGTGALRDYRDTFAPVWHPFRRVWRPTPSDPATARTASSGYFKFFGRAAGPRGKGYYSYNLGDWHVVVLNSDCRAVRCGRGSAQLRWLDRDLSKSRAKCTLAYWHKPLFSSGASGKGTARKRVKPFWQVLDKHRAEIVVNASDMIYERFAPQNARGRVSRKSGIRQFVAGTGGRSHGEFAGIRHGSEVRINDQFGALKLKLQDGAYNWLFVAEQDGMILDHGRTRCH